MYTTTKNLDVVVDALGLIYIEGKKRVDLDHYLFQNHKIHASHWNGKFYEAGSSAARLR